MKNKQDMKNIILLRNLPSNIIDEAIIVLKDSYPQDKIEAPKENKHIIDEATLLISEYIENYKKDKSQDKKIAEKYKKIKLVNKILILGSCICLGMTILF